MSLKGRLVRSAAGLRRLRVGHALARAAEGFVAGFDNRANWHIESNGEGFVLDRLASFDPAVVFDVGANVGDWTRAAAIRLERATIHAFEPVSDTVAELRRAAREIGPRVEVHPCALGAVAETRRLSASGTKSTHISLLEHATATTSGGEYVDVDVGHDFCSRHGIDHIDLLKIDTEGFDHLVLQGFEPLLASGEVDVVQFEYGEWALRTKFLLFDFYGMLHELGYSVGKLYPRGVAFGPYSIRLEDFRGLNFVAVREARGELIRALSER